MKGYVARKGDRWYAVIFESVDKLALAHSGRVCYQLTSHLADEGVGSAQANSDWLIPMAEKPMVTTVRSRWSMAASRWISPPAANGQGDGPGEHALK